MKVFIALCIMAVALSHPVKDDEASNEDHVIQRRDVDPTGANQNNETQVVDGVALQDDSIQEAISNEGAIARQSDEGQYVYASDFGGPIVQIKQHVYKTNCCSCGCDCDCSQEEAANAPPSE